MVRNNNIVFCTRCYHTWRTRGKTLPKQCPNRKCHSPYWNAPRKKIPRGLAIKYQEAMLKIHEQIIKISGGEQGVRDEGGIYFSVYSILNHTNKRQGDPLSLGAFILNEFARKHHFSDGNKRSAFVFAKTFMLVNRCHLQVEYEDAVDFIIRVAEYKSKISFNEIKIWLEDNCEIIEEKDVETYINKIFVNLSLKENNDGS